MPGTLRPFCALSVFNLVLTFALFQVPASQARQACKDPGRFGIRYDFTGKGLGFVKGSQLTPFGFQLGKPAWLVRGWTGLAGWYPRTLWVR